MPIVPPQKMSDRLAGVFPVFRTPYRDDESIDYAVLDREINWLLEQGADGFVMAMVFRNLAPSR